MKIIMNLYEEDQFVGKEKYKKTKGTILSLM